MRLSQRLRDMQIADDPFKERYLTVANDGQIHQGWQQGWNVFHAVGSPAVNLDAVKVDSQPHGLRDVGPLHLAEIWPDTEHYDQNSPGIMEKAKDVDQRFYKSRLEKSFWLNVLRVPLCISYLAACAKVRPSSILELGTGGDSAHSTGIFLYWLELLPSCGFLVSVDRHPLSHTWPRYRDNVNWQFVQGDSINVLHALIEKRLPIRMHFDMIFIDSSHNYPETLAELKQASMLTNSLLLDDTTFPGVKQALDEWHPQNQDWLRVDLHGAVALFERHPRNMSEGHGHACDTHKQECPNCSVALFCNGCHQGGGSYYWQLQCNKCDSNFVFDTYRFTLEATRKVYP